MPISAPEPKVAPLYAGFWRRAAAAGIDGFILLLPTGTVSIFMHEHQVLGFILNAAIGCAYWMGFHGSALQASPGKLALGIKVTDNAGERISYARAAGRFFATWISSIIFCIGYLIAAWTERKRALHDMIAGTLVVNRKADPAEVVAGGGTMPVTGGVMAFIVLLVFVPFVIGILAAIAIPAVLDFKVRARVAGVIHETTPLRTEIQDAFAKKEPYKTGRREIPSSSDAQSVEIDSTGEMVIMFPQRMGGGGALVFKPIVDSAGAMTWRCFSRGMNERYLPAVCRGGK